MASDCKQPWEMTDKEFKSAFKTVRHFHHYSHEDRAALQASHRQGPTARNRVGEFWYTHPLVGGNVAFDRPIDARWKARHDVVSEALRAGLTVPIHVLNDFPTLRDGAVCP